MFTRDTLFKTTGINGKATFGGKGKWDLPEVRPSGTIKKGRWRVVSQELIPCVRGLHLCRGESLYRWLAPEIYEAEIHPDALMSQERGWDKIVVHKARLVRKAEHWTPVNQRIFACDLAGAVLGRILRVYRNDHFNYLMDALIQAREFALLEEHTIFDTPYWRKWRTEIQQYQSDHQMELSEYTPHIHVATKGFEVTALVGTAYTIEAINRIMSLAEVLFLQAGYAWGEQALEMLFLLLNGETGREE